MPWNPRLSVARDEAEQLAFFLLQSLGVVCQAEGSRGSRDLRTDDSAHGWSQILEGCLDSLWGKCLVAPQSHCGGGPLLAHPVRTGS